MGNDLEERAKKALAAYLEKEGYTDVLVTSSPCDMIAVKDERNWFFELKTTTKNDKYFGAATETEWAQALETPETFRFVVVIEDNEGMKFKMFEPNDFMKYSSIPPFKVYFNLDLSNENNESWKVLEATDKEVKRNSISRQKNGIGMSKDNFYKIHGEFDELRTDS